jgi:hypothetical protein
MACMQECVTGTLKEVYLLSQLPLALLLQYFLLCDAQRIVQIVHLDCFLPELCLQLHTRLWFVLATGNNLSSVSRRLPHLTDMVLPAKNVHEYGVCGRKRQYSEVIGAEVEKTMQMKVSARTLSSGNVAADGLHSFAHCSM